jgi:hypothetical protein
VALALIGIGRAAVIEPLGLALWCVVVAWLCVPLMWDASGVDASRYAVVLAVVTIGAMAFAGFIPALIVAAVALSMMGGVLLLAALRVPAAVAIGMVLVSTAIAFGWPVWAATFLTRVNTDPWLQWLVNVSPAFALNAALSPEDPLTHRPLAYQLMNLGQDVMYSMPASAWPCVVLHGAVGVVGVGGWWVVSRRSSRVRPTTHDQLPTTTS